MKLLRAVSVVKVLGGSRVLRGVEASFDVGRVHVIEGANGSGKSTLLAVLGGRSSPTSGRALLQDGATVVAEGAALRSVVGWLGHDLGLYPDLTAFENVALHARLRGADPTAAWTRIADRMAIEPLRARRVREMSRGQRQRIALGRVLVGEPAVLLLDEPSTGLDHAAVARLAGLLEKVVGEGAIVVAVTHDEAFAGAIGGVRWAMGEGKLTRKAD